MPQKVGPVALARFKAALPLGGLHHCIGSNGHEKCHVESARKRLLENVDANQIPIQDPVPLIPRFADPTLNYKTPVIPEDEIYTCTIYKNGEVGFQREHFLETRFISAPDIPIDFEYLEHTVDHPLIVDLTGALLTVYDPELKKGDPIVYKHFLDGKFREANEAIFRYMQYGGAIDERGIIDDRAQNLLAIATLMDTSCKPLKPRQFHAGSFIKASEFYSKISDGAKLMIGAGLEYLFDEINLGEEDVNSALAKGKVTKEAYIKHRKKALWEIGNISFSDRPCSREQIVPIVTASGMQDGLSVGQNIRILSLIAHDVESRVIPGLVLHRLGSPYLNTTDWHTRDVTEGAACHYTGGVKTSPPDIHSQLKEDYPSIKASGTEMLTGDDKNFALIWLWGAMRQLEEREKRGKDFTDERNGFHFIKGANIHGLLGNTGLAPHRMIAGIIELSKWYHAKVENKPNADDHLTNYLEIMLPYTAMSFYSFFGPYRHTPSYPQAVEAAHVFAGVHDRTKGTIPPHRRAKEEKHQSQLYDGGLLALYALARAQGPEQIADIVKRNPNEIIIPA